MLKKTILFATILFPIANAGITIHHKVDTAKKEFLQDEETQDSQSELSDYYTNVRNVLRIINVPLKQKQQENKYLKETAMKYSESNPQQASQIIYAIPRISLLDINNFSARDSTYISMPTFIKIMRMPILRNDTEFCRLCGVILILWHEKMAKQMKDQIREPILAKEIAKEKDRRKKNLSIDYEKTDITFVDLSESDIAHILYKSGISLLKQAKSLKLKSSSQNDPYTTILDTISPNGRDKENLSEADIEALHTIYEKIMSMPKYKDLKSINEFFELHEQNPKK